MSYVVLILIVLAIIVLAYLNHMIDEETKAYKRLTEEIRSWRVAGQAPIVVRFDNPLDVVNWKPDPIPEKAPEQKPSGQGIAALVKDMPKGV